MGHLENISSSEVSWENRGTIPLKIASVPGRLYPIRMDSLAVFWVTPMVDASQASLIPSGRTKLVTQNRQEEGTYSTDNSYQTELNSSVMEKMNEHASKVDPSCKLIVLHLNGGMLNNGIPAYETLIVTQKNFPEPVKEGHTFQFWCTDTDTRRRTRTLSHRRS